MPHARPMVPLDYHGPAHNCYVESLIRQEAWSVGLLALRHAIMHQSPGVWGDHEIAANSLLLLREGDGQLEAFGWGRPFPAVRWLVNLGLPTVLAAPSHWQRTVKVLIKAQTAGRVETWLRAARPEPRNASTAATRRLTLDDAAAFAASAPPWALQGWLSFDALIAHGAAFGVPHGHGFASLAWVFDESSHFDSVSVYTASRFRRLGLARAAAAALLRHIQNDRRKHSLWSTTPDNTPSRTLAHSFGFVPKTEETLLRWPVRKGVAKVEERETAFPCTRSSWT